MGSSKKSSGRMVMKHSKYYLIGFLLVLLDQATKVFFYGKNFDFGLVAITFTRNTGISFGLLEGTNHYIAIISVAVLIGLWHYRAEFKGKETWLLLITSGIIGNLLDRIFRGYVVDFIDLKFWPIFNFADSYLTIGVLMLIIVTIKKDIIKKKN